MADSGAVDMDIDEVVGELYGLRPSEFIAARDTYAARARSAGDAAAAQRIAGLRRPTLAVWASNLLARRRPAEAEQFLQLGRALREAHRSLDAAQLRDLGHQQHQVMAALAHQARDLAGEAGQSVSDSVVQEVEQILRAVLTDEDVARQWAAGSLEKAPSAPVGFTGLEPAPGVTPARTPPKAPGGQPAPAPPAAPAAPAPGAAGTKRSTRAADKRRAAQLERARAQAREATRQAERADGAVEEAEQAQAEATGRAEESGERVADLEGRLREARQEHRTARTAADLATRELREARAEAKAARRTADTARRALELLSLSAESETEEGPDDGA
ncbi:hypothetical protein GCM10014713_23160 [Streptomyces purpureus]|uniref:Uncharacterized protein n=2 Tax=Streptomyces purpureus TaxID=1951 RepID=A0A918H060_9ACTN|nr:hypothetical protein GCM10014713_23160 [Streptomyces purpureus]